MGLRHAGAVIEPVQLGRAKQDAVLLRVFVDVRIQAQRAGCTLPGGYARNLTQVRAALRLDDPVLDDLIKQGAHRRPWSSTMEVPTSTRS